MSSRRCCPNQDIHGFWTSMSAWKFSFELSLTLASDGLRLWRHTKRDVVVPHPPRDAPFLALSVKGSSDFAQTRETAVCFV